MRGRFEYVKPNAGWLVGVLDPPSAFKGQVDGLISGARISREAQEIEGRGASKGVGVAGVAGWRRTGLCLAGDVVEWVNARQRDAMPPCWRKNWCFRTMRCG